MFLLSIPGRIKDAIRPNEQLANERQNNRELSDLVEHQDQVIDELHKVMVERGRLVQTIHNESIRRLAAVVASMGGSITISHDLAKSIYEAPQVHIDIVPGENSVTMTLRIEDAPDADAGCCEGECDSEACQS